MLWNYRGYGDSTGSCNFDVNFKINKNLKSDSESVLSHIKKLHNWSLIGAHGISIGGVPVCHLAR